MKVIAREDHKIFENNSRCAEPFVWQSEYKFNTDRPNKTFRDSIWYLISLQCIRCDSKMKFPWRQQLQYQNQYLSKQPPQQQKKKKNGEKMLTKNFVYILWMEKCARWHFFQIETKKRTESNIYKNKLLHCWRLEDGWLVARINALQRPQLDTKELFASASALVLHIQTLLLDEQISVFHSLLCHCVNSALCLQCSGTQCAHFVVW